jgi:AraC family transcriptional regulator
MSQPHRHYGEVRWRHEQDGFGLAVVRHERGRALPSHGHERAFFCLVSRGGYAERYGRTDAAYDARSVLFHPPAFHHQDQIAPGGSELLVVEIGPDLFRRTLDHGPIEDSRQDRHGGELAQAAWRLERECRESRAMSPLVIEGLVLEMLGIVSRPDTGARGWPAWLAPVLDRIRDSLDARNTVHDLACGAGVHPVTLSQAFRRHLGMGVGDYVRAQRVRWVEERLARPDADLAGLAAEAGFADQSHMIRSFRRVTGRTPGEIRTGRRRIVRG